MLTRNEFRSYYTLSRTTHSSLSQTQTTALYPLYWALHNDFSGNNSKTYNDYKDTKNTKTISPEAFLHYFEDIKEDTKLRNQGVVARDLGLSQSTLSIRLRFYDLQPSNPNNTKDTKDTKDTNNNKGL